MAKWSNWAGNLKSNPNSICYPKNESEIKDLILQSKKQKSNIRITGSGHSWTGLCPTNDTLISLDNYQGLIDVDTTNNITKVKGGTKLNLLGKQLYEKGFAMENLGDIDVQSIAGAVSTGTHGTGTSFGIIPTQVVGIKFINGNGDLIECSTTENVAIFKAAQLSLGTLGIITELSLKVEPAYKLKFTADKSDFTECLNQLEQHNKEHRNFEFYWFPHTNTVQTKFTNKTDEAIVKSGIGSYITDVVLENYLFKAMCELTKLIPSTSAAIAKISAKAVSTSSKTNWSHLVYAMPRLVKFNEMEYNVPLVNFKDCVNEIKACVESQKFEVHFPTENRFVKGDDIYLSPSYGRDSAYISCHVYKGKEYQPYFSTLESIFKNHGGRPHWGKLHTQKASDLETLYPMWDKYQEIREQMDPSGLFLNPYLRNLLIA